MANTFGVCLLFVFCCANLSFARQLPKECSKGPTFWCQSLRVAADCGAVGHCSSTVWETKTPKTNSHNEVSDKFLRLFRQLKDVKDLINEDYLATRIASACHDVPYPALAAECKRNTAGLEQYVHHVLKSDTSAQTICDIVGMCNNEKLDDLVSRKKKTEKETKRKIHYTGGLLGRTHCSWGPDYWCSNFSTSHECKAVSHCVSRVWSKMHVPEDTDSICKICTDMVTQARDQLLSNETQEELKEVFEGSCDLIRIKIVRKGCIKLADEFVPELVETLSSEMNPQQVCSVAGLCNSEKIDKMLIGYNAQLELRAGCNNCSRTVNGLRRKFDATSYEDFLVGLLKVCRKMDSLSDSCSMLVFKYYENIVAAAKKDLTAQSVCHVSGQCAYRFHQHDDYIFPEETVQEGDDIPCEFCEQLVKHMRDTLVANTTEIEFYKVMQGLCKQTGKFREECLHLAQEYYPIIYEFLTKDLNPPQVCALMGICSTEPTIALMLPEEIKAGLKNQLIGNDERNSYNSDAPKKLARVPLSKATNVRVLGSKPPSDVAGVLPIERMLISPTQPQGKPVCTFCEYFLHYLQVELSDTTNIQKVTDAVDSACEKLPRAVTSECKQFVDQYGPSVVALLVQEIDPASVCPALGLCLQTTAVRRVTINASKSSCPLCLFAVEQIRAEIKDDRSVEGIRKALDNLCTHLSAKLKTNCVDFVDTYTEQLVEMLAADLDPQEICCFLKICKDEVHDPLKLTHNNIDKFFEKPHLRGDRNNFRKHSMLPKHFEIETNKIPDNTVNGRPIHAAAPKTACAICQFVMTELDNEIKDKHNEDEIKNIVHHVCKRMPKSVRNDCDQFVDKYAQLIISYLAQELEPVDICEKLELCPKDDVTVVNAPAQAPKAPPKTVCVVCEFIMKELDEQIKDKHNDDDIMNAVHNICKHMPKSVRGECDQFVEKYGQLVISLLAKELEPSAICGELKLCPKNQMTAVKEEILDCAVCETVVMAVKKVLANDKVDHDIVKVVERSCGLLPAKYSARCHTMLEIYGDSVIRLIEEFGTKGVCQKIGLCTSSDAAYVRMYREERNW